MLGKIFGTLCIISFICALATGNIGVLGASRGAGRGVGGDGFARAGRRDGAMERYNARARRRGCDPRAGPR